MRILTAVTLAVLLAVAAANPSKRFILEDTKDALNKLGHKLAGGASAVLHGAQHLGHTIANKTAAAGHSIASGAQHLGHGIVSGAQHLGHGIVSGAQHLGHIIANKTSAIGHGIVHGAQALGHKVKQGAHAIGRRDVKQFEHELAKDAKHVLHDLEDLTHIHTARQLACAIYDDVKDSGDRLCASKCRSIVHLGHLSSKCRPACDFIFKEAGKLLHC